MLPIVEYILHTRPMGPHGISAHDLACAYGIASESDRLLAPFSVPGGAPETEQCKEKFTRFRELYGIVTREARENAANTQWKENATRVARQFEPGETVFRQLPKPARVGKNQFLSPVLGPYTVERQPTLTSLILRDARQDKLVGDGALIPLDQIIAGPRRTRLEFAKNSDTRPFSQMIDPTRSREVGAPHPEDRPRSGQYVGRTKGWGPLAAGAEVAYQTITTGNRQRELSIGRVLTNNREEQTVIVQPMRSRWKGTRIVFDLLYQTPEGQTTTATQIYAKTTVLYSAMVLRV